MIDNRNTLAVLLKEIRKAKDFDDFGNFVFQLFNWLGAKAVYLKIKEFNQKFFQLQLRVFPDISISKRLLAGEVDSFLHINFPNNADFERKPLKIDVKNPNSAEVELLVYWPDFFEISKIETEIELLQPVLSLKMEQLRLAQNIAKYEEMLANSIDIMMLIERGTLEYVSPQVGKFIGYNRDELENFIQSKQIFQPEDRVEIESKILADNKRKKQFSKREYQIKQKDGTINWIEWVVRRVFDEQGEVIRMILNFRDVSDKKEAQEELKHQKIFLQQILDRLPVEVFLKDSERKYIFINQSAAESIGLEIDAVLGKCDEEILERSISKKNRIDDERVLKGKHVSEIHEIIKKGRTFTFLTNKQLVSVENKNVILGYSVDITEQRINEIKLQESTEFINRSIQIIPDSIFIFDLTSFSYVFTNDKIFKKLGYYQKDIKGDLKSFIASIIHPDDRHLYFDQIIEIRKGEKDLYELEYRVVDHKGKTRWLFSRKSPFKRNQLGEVDQFVGITFDITDQKHREENLIHTREKMEKALNAREEFLSVISHEIRTPLNAILGIANLLNNKLKDHEHSEMLRILISSGDNLMLMINDILDFSKVRADQLLFDKSVFSLKDVLKSTCLGHETLIQKKKLFFEFKIDPEIPDKLVGDSLRLTQIFNNLLSNAVKFTSKGFVKCGVNLLNNSGSAVDIMFYVEDSGIGIPKSMHTTIFDPFKQVSSKTTRKYGGTGLGLSITKELVERQGGRLTLKSKLNEGTKFSVQLTFEIAKSSKWKTISEQNKRNRDFKFNYNKVLYVEDVASNRYLMKAYSKDWNLDLILAENGFQASELLQNEKIELILMDIQMPEIDGFQTLKRMKELKIQVPPVIALTAEINKTIIQKIKSEGMYNYLPKPIQMEKLFDMIRSVFEGKETKKSKTNDHVHKKVLELYGNDSKEYLEYLEQVKIEMKQYEKDIIKSFMDRDFELLKNTRHKMKGALGIFQMNYLSDFLENIEESMFQKENNVARENAYVELQDHFKRAFNDLHFDRNEKKENLVKS